MPVKMAEYVLHQYLKPNKRTVEDEYDEISWHSTFSYSHVKKNQKWLQMQINIDGDRFAKESENPKNPHEWGH